MNKPFLLLLLVSSLGLKAQAMEEEDTTNKTQKQTQQLYPIQEEFTPKHQRSQSELVPQSDFKAPRKYSEYSPASEPAHMYPQLNKVFSNTSVILKENFLLKNPTDQEVGYTEKEQQLQPIINDVIKGQAIHNGIKFQKNQPAQQKSNTSSTKSSQQDNLEPLLLIQEGCTKLNEQFAKINAQIQHFIAQQLN